MKKTVITISVIVTLLISPIIQVCYYDTDGITVIKQSIVKTIIRDIQDGTIGTGK